MSVPSFHACASSSLERVRAVCYVGVWVGRLFGKLFLVWSWMFLHHHLGCVVFHRIQPWVPSRGSVGVCFGRGGRWWSCVGFDSSALLSFGSSIFSAGASRRATRRRCAAGPNLIILKYSSYPQVEENEGYQKRKIENNCAETKHP